MALSRMHRARPLFTCAMTNARKKVLAFPADPSNSAVRRSRPVPTTLSKSLRASVTRTLNSPLAPNSTGRPELGSKSRTLESVPHFRPNTVARLTK